MKLSTSIAATLLAFATASSPAVYARSENKNLRRNTQVSSAVCNTAQVLEFDCYINQARDIVGVYVCRGGATTCVDPSATSTGTDTCGCCPGDTRWDCQMSADEQRSGGTWADTPNDGPSEDDGDDRRALSWADTPNDGPSEDEPMGTGGNMWADTPNDGPSEDEPMGTGGNIWADTPNDGPSEDGAWDGDGDDRRGLKEAVEVMEEDVENDRELNAICSAFQIAEFDCYINERLDIVGVYVCRNGRTTCARTNQLRPRDTCGCCAGDNRVDCLDDNDGPSADGTSSSWMWGWWP